MLKQRNTHRTHKPKSLRVVEHVSKRSGAIELDDGTSIALEHLPKARPDDAIAIDGGLDDLKPIGSVRHVSVGALQKAIAAQTRLLTRVGQYLYESAGSFPADDSPEIALTCQIEQLLGVRFELPKDVPVPALSAARLARELGQALVQVLNEFPITLDLCRALYGVTDADPSRNLAAVPEDVCRQALALQGAMTAAFNAGLSEHCTLDLDAQRQHNLALTRQSP